MDAEILELIKKRVGHAPPMSLYTKIGEWSDWWRGRCETFHTSIEPRAGGSPVRRDMYKMGMAKKICEDWATILINDRTDVRTADAKVNAVLFGEKDTEGLLTGGSFWGRLNELVEETFALGTGAVSVQFEGAQSDAGHNLVHARTMRFNYVTADRLIPLVCEDGTIVSAAMVGNTEIWYNGVYRPVRVLEIHQKEYGEAGGVRYRVDNVLLDEDARELPLPEGILSYFYVPRPLFSILTPNVVNADPVGGRLGMGASIFGSSIDHLKGVDLAYNNFCRDLYLGGKKVFMNQTLTQEDGYGNRIAPDDVAQQLFVTVGDNDLGSNPLIVEHNPDLRTDENRAAVQAQLDYLSFKVGFGTRHYRFAGEHMITATQYAGEKQELLQHAMKHYIHVERFLKTLVEIGYWFAVSLAGIELPPPGRIDVTFDDSFFIDPTAERQRDLGEVSAGLLAPWEYRVRYFGESPADAKAAIAAIRNEGERGRGAV